MRTLYCLEHTYELMGNDESKFIGIYASREKAEEVIEEYKKLPGFKDHPNDFYIKEYEMNVDYWRDGF